MRWRLPKLARNGHAPAGRRRPFLGGKPTSYLGERRSANDLDAHFSRTKWWKFGATQSIHSLTRAARSAGRDKPSLLKAARLALMVNCVGPAIGRSAGFAPRKILSTYLAAS